MRSRSARQATGSKKCFVANGHQPVSPVRSFLLILRDEISSLPEICMSLTTGASFFCCDAHPTSAATDMTRSGAPLQCPIPAKFVHSGLDRNKETPIRGRAITTYVSKQFSCRKNAGNSRCRMVGGMSSARGGIFGVQIHDAGDRALDGIFRLIALGDEDRPLEQVLTSMCVDVAAIARADVASIYVREAGDDGPRFTMRGNVGFPPEAIGRVHLRAGEGITGFAAERMRPVSVAVGKHDRHFKYISGLGEEKYP